MYYATTGNNNITGTDITTASVTVTTGNRWVLIGSVSTPMPASALTSSPTGAIVPGTLYGFSGSSYFVPTELEPGQAYWVFVRVSCTVMVGASAAFSEIEVTTKSAASPK